MTRAAEPAAVSGLTSAQLRRLRPLRGRFGVHRDLFDGRELARLRFARWLYQTGRLSS
jgi:hypothetical protein